MPRLAIHCFSRVYTALFADCLQFLDTLQTEIPSPLRVTTTNGEKPKVFTVFALIFVLAGFPTATESSAKSTIAVAEFDGQDLSASEIAGVTDFVRTGLVKTNSFDIVDRRNMEAILKEHEFQQSGCTSQECTIKMGKLLNVQKMVTGAIVQLDYEYIITANVIDIETGKIVVSERINSPEKKQFADNCDELAQNIADRLSGKKVKKAKKVKVSPARDTL